MPAMNIRMGLSQRASGGGASPTAPIVSGVSYDDILDELTFSVSGTEPMTMHYVSTASATPPSQGTIIATPDGTETVTAGVNYIDQLTTNPNPGTWYLHFLVSNSGGNSATQTVTYVGAAFDPASIPSVQIFFDIGDMTTLWQNTDGTGPVTASGQPLGSVTNRGSLGGLFLNTGAGARPTYTEASGRKFFETNGTNQFLRLDRGASSAFTTSGGFYLWLLAFDDGTARPLGGSEFLTIAGTGSQQYNTQSGLVIYSKDTSTDPVSSGITGGLDNTQGIQGQLRDLRTTDLPWSIIEFECVPTAASPNFWMRVERAADGGVPVAIASGSTSNPGFPDTMTAAKVMALGCGLGSGGALQSFHKCSIAAGILASGTLTTTERDNIRAFLRTRAAF